MKKNMKKSLFIAALTLINFMNYCQEFSCIGPSGNNLCAGLGTKDASGQVKNSDWCRSQLLSVFIQQFVGGLYGTESNVFEEKNFKKHFSDERIDKTLKILTCIEKFIKKYSTGDKTLWEPANAIFDDINLLIYNTRLAYTTVFSKSGPFDLKTYTELKKLIQSFGIMHNRTKALREKLQKITYYYTDKKVTKQFILELATIVEDVSEKALNDAGNMVQKRSKDFQFSAPRSTDQLSIPTARRPSLL